MTEQIRMLNKVLTILYYIHAVVFIFLMKQNPNVVPNLLFKLDQSLDFIKGKLTFDTWAEQGTKGRRGTHIKQC